MYMSYNGATCVYTCCISVRACICGKIQFLAMGNAKGDFKFSQGNGKRPYEKVFIG
jgi:hypothetical protein